MLIYTITIIDVVLVLGIEFLIQRKEMRNVFSFFTSVSLLKTIEQMLIVVLSASIAILITDYVQTQKTKNRYSTLLRNLYAELDLEEQFLNDYINKTPGYESFFEVSDEEFNGILKSYDVSLIIDTVLNKEESVLILSPILSGYLMSNVRDRRNLLDSIYAYNYSEYGGDRDECIALLDETDCRLAYLILSQAKYVEGSDDTELLKEYMKYFWDTDLE